ncbi:hypothetical protein KL920_001197 [Ogataea angusta]|nr:hypothetical protein KL920_001197 [Ogataea angusta]KAG7834824.1 hypothetical protein KL943_002139 [Ogataea angusta]
MVEINKSPPNKSEYAWTPRSANSVDLSHVPCKFFKQGACQAGNSCPFSHSTESASETNVCKYFQKGNCRFGAKCALVHMLPDGRRVSSKSTKPARPRTSASSTSSDTSEWSRPRLSLSASPFTQSIWSCSTAGSPKGLGPALYASFTTVDDTAVESDENMDSLEDFVPGSLSELLTTEELRRRSKPADELVNERNEFREFRDRIDKGGRELWEMQFVME